MFIMFAVKTLVGVTLGRNGLQMVGLIPGHHLIHDPVQDQTQV